MKNKSNSTKFSKFIKIINKSLFIVIVLCSISFIYTCFLATDYILNDDDDDDNLRGRGASCIYTDDCKSGLHCLSKVCRTGNECYKDEGCDNPSVAPYSCKNEPTYCFETKQECRDYSYCN